MYKKLMDQLANKKSCRKKLLELHSPYQRQPTHAPMLPPIFKITTLIVKNNARKFKGWMCSLLMLISDLFRVEEH